MDPCQTVEEALRVIQQYEGSPEDFELAIANSMNDAIGMNMAIVGDAILARGWLPNGFEDKADHRVYRYKAMQ